MRTQGMRVVQSDDPRVYDPTADNDDVALRALIALAQRGHWSLLEELGVEVTNRFRAAILLLGDSFGNAAAGRSGFRSDEAMEVVRATVPELVPVAQSVRALYKIKTRLEMRLLFA
jgi:hypothetical protein